MKLRVIVQVWCEVDPTLNLRVNRQTAAPMAEIGDSLTRVSPLGRFGVTEALRLPGADVIAFAVGDVHESALRHALAAGASRAVQVRFEGPAMTAPALSALAGWLAGEKPDLVIAGWEAGQLAARLGWAHLAGLDHLRHEPGVLSAIRQFGRGAHEHVTAVLPAIVRLQTEAPRPMYVARARIAQADHHAIDCCVLPIFTSAAEPVASGPLQMSRPRTRAGVGVNQAPAKAADRLSALMGLAARGARPAAKAAEPAARSPEEMAEEFVRYVAHHNLLPLT